MPMASIEVELTLGKASPALRALLRKLILEVLIEMKGSSGMSEAGLTIIKLMMETIEIFIQYAKGSNTIDSLVEQLTAINQSLAQMLEQGHDNRDDQGTGSRSSSEGVTSQD